MESDINWVDQLSDNWSRKMTTGPGDLKDTRRLMSMSERESSSSGAVARLPRHLLRADGDTLPRHLLRGIGTTRSPLPLPIERPS